MHPTGVATAAWVFASAHSKTPFYLAGGLLAGWAVGLGAFGVMHPDFPGSTAASRLVMLISAVLVAGAVTTAVTTAGEESATEGATAPPTGSAAPTSGLNLSADPTGKLAYDKKQATVGAGRFAVRLVNNSSLPHNVTIAKGARVRVQTKTVSGGSATATADLAPGEYVFSCSVDASPGRGDAGHAHRQMSGLLRPRGYERACRATLVPARGDEGSGRQAAGRCRATCRNRIGAAPQRRPERWA